MRARPAEHMHSCCTLVALFSSPCSDALNSHINCHINPAQAHADSANVGFQSVDPCFSKTRCTAGSPAQAIHYPPEHEKCIGLLWLFTCLQSLPALALNKPSSSSSSPPVGGGGRRRGGLEEACCRKTSWPTPSLAKGSTRRQSRCSARCIWWSSGCSGRGGFTQR